MEGAPNNFWQWWESTPEIDKATLEFAELLVTSLGLGRDGSPDFLNVSVSATDRVGHAYGPGSREQLDNLLRLDSELGEFFTFLDRTVGKGRWTMMLSADHGVLDSPEDLLARGEYAHRLTPAELANLDSLRVRAARNPDHRAAAQNLVAELKKLPIIGDAWTHEQLFRSTADSFMVLQRRSLYPGRFDGLFSREDVEFRFIPNVLTRPRGSGHGQTYWYDRHVPMIFMGGGVRHGQSPMPAQTVDFAPTAAAILGIPYPNDIDGKVLGSVVGK
jgi:predicted AlkP superfamily pyrophosphatase or phosphodiesterase